MTASAASGAAAPREVVLIAGKDPLLEIGGGHSAYVRAHARAAVRGGMNPHLFCVSDRPGVVETEFGTVHRIRSLVPLRVQAGMGSPRYLPFVPIHVRQLAVAVAVHLLPRPGPHLLHGFGVWGLSGCLVRERLRQRGVEAISLLSIYTTVRHESRARIRGAAVDGPFGASIGFRARERWVRTVAGRCERKALAGSDRVLLNYESVRRLLSEIPHDGANCDKLPYTSEAAFTGDEWGARQSDSPAPVRLAPAGVPLILAVSRHDPRKGIDVLLHALSRLRGRHVPFFACLVGGGPLLDAHRRLAERLGVADVTSFEGFVDNVAPYFRSADVFVLPSLEEGSGSLSLIEALQAGVAVVASRCDGIPEDVDDGDSALLVPPGDPEALASSLSRALEDPVLRRSLSRRARETFAAKFTADRFTGALLATYRTALARGGRS